MGGSRLPNGFAVALDPRVRVLGDGATLLGGAPTRLLRLNPTAQSLLAGGRVTVHDAVTAKLARMLLDATVAHPRPITCASMRDVTVVIPVRDNMAGLRRVLSTLADLPVVIVDDGSAHMIDPADLGNPGADVKVIRHRRSRGPAAARNTGLAACHTEYVAFLDSDVVPRPGWLEAVLRHFSDPGVALAAPRIEALSGAGGAVARYEAIRSSLDLGIRESPVIPYGPVSYVPAAAIVGRRAVLVELGGFDEALKSGEDVDLCWRLVDRGARLRYDPSAVVAHDHRVSLRKWLARKAFYGTSAAPLWRRHPDKIAPLMLSRWTLAMWLLIATGLRPGWVMAALIAAAGGRRTADALAGAGLRYRDVAVIVTEGIVAAGLQLASAVCRHYWPAAVLGALVSRRCRRVVVVAALADGVVDWIGRRRTAGETGEHIGLLPYLVLRRLDDLAYGTGVWSGVVRQRTLGPLKPRIRR
ncbi:mycofactocin biosynthesis glycosyltransferase MftF (plasmid) [Mycolicibacterium fluoranthenivorans]|uniref:Mycofactocin biosynthesis glycosyltransferase MftF n=1 Tax=Mycolicibacterium fluoranthenivorans TaxID=258505 RepID=A0A7G8PQG9_9MYCO|nr:mycofactocin biosynthesis glycosyltransferase MftF [Mycolicibacterium fluoranthenivorans]QNJ96585.1 mycofactocin biosynthesis glycosyltransferase MftF [Mycolicibacterium fluoranthenivorans]